MGQNGREEYTVKEGTTWREFGTEKGAIDEAGLIDPNKLGVAGLSGNYIATVNGSNLGDNKVELDQPITVGTYYCCWVAS